MAGRWTQRMRGVFVACHRGLSSTPGMAPELFALLFFLLSPFRSFYRQQVRNLFLPSCNTFYHSSNCFAEVTLSISSMYYVTRGSVLIGRSRSFTDWRNGTTAVVPLVTAMVTRTFLDLQTVPLVPSFFLFRSIINHHNHFPLVVL